MAPGWMLSMRSPTTKSAPSSSSCTTVAPAARASWALSSSEALSTTMISPRKPPASSPWRASATQRSMFAASFRHGITTETRGSCPVSGAGLLGRLVAWVELIGGATGTRKPAGRLAGGVIVANAQAVSGAISEHQSVVAERGRERRERRRRAALRLQVDDPHALEQLGTHGGEQVEL